MLSSWYKVAWTQKNVNSIYMVPDVSCFPFFHKTVWKGIFNFDFLGMVHMCYSQIIFQAWDIVYLINVSSICLGNYH